MKMLSLVDGSSDLDLCGLEGTKRSTQCYGFEFLWHVVSWTIWRCWFVGWADWLGRWVGWWVRGCVGSWIYWYFDCVSFDWLVYCLKQLLVDCLWWFTAIKISTFKYLSIMLVNDGHKCHARWMDGGWFLGRCYDVSFRECKKDSSCRVRYNSATSTDFPG